MQILVVCQTCKTRFQVSEKFAGKQGPCPKCKAVITIPKLDEQVKIHEPEEYSGGGSVSAKDATGRAVLKPISRDKARLQPIVFVASAAGALVTLVVAYLLRGHANTWILGAGAALLAPPLVLAGYFAMRDAESEPYRGTALWLRVAIVSAVYAALWGITWIFATFVFTEGGGAEVWQLMPPTAIMVVAGTIAALATLDLEPINAFFHYTFYLVITVLLRVVIALPPLPGMADEATAAAAPTVMVASGGRSADAANLRLVQLSRGAFDA